MSKEIEFEVEKGPQRQYLRTFIPNDLPTFPTQKNPKLILIALLLTGLLVRLAFIQYPDSVVFNEIGTGKFINYYLKGIYFVDVDPPLAKFIYSGISYMFGYRQPSFIFTSIGLPYSSNAGELLFPYLPNRIFSAFASTCTLLLAYRTLKSCGVRDSLCAFGTILLIFENSLVTQSRFMFSESAFLFFFAMSISSFKATELLTFNSIKWYKALFIASIGVGYALSTDWIGILTLVWLLVVEVKRFWIALGDLNVPVKSTFQQTITKLGFFLSIPLTIYLFVFSIHLRSLDRVGPDYRSMSPEFQKDLIGNHLGDIVADISYGSTVSLRHYKTGMYLHSENATYPNGDQQVTLFDHHDDSGNLFFIEKRVKANLGELVRKTQTIESGRTIRIFHNDTEKYLNINGDAKPPLSEQEYNKEVTVKGNRTWIGDHFLNFEFRAVPEYTKSEIGKKRLRSIESVFQIYNGKNKCYVLGTSNKLPKEWSNNQYEVICIEKPTLEDSLWYFEFNDHPKFTKENERIEIRKLSIFEKIIEVHQAMFTLISSIIDKFDFKSTPLDWVSVNKGIKYWIKDGRAIYFLGNFITYYFVLIAVVVFALFKLILLVSYNPNVVSTQTAEFAKFDYHATDFFVGYLIHLLPFFLVSRDLLSFFYFPALYFGVLLTCQMLEFIFASASKSQKALVSYFLVFVAFAVITVFSKYSPFIYGLDWTEEECNSAMFGPNWDRICGVYKQ